MKKIYDIKKLKSFYKTYNRLPNSNIKEEKSLYSWMSRKRKNNKEVIEFLDSISYEKIHSRYTIIDLINFYKINNRLPNSHIKEEKNLYNWMYYSKRREEDKVIEFINSVGYKKIYKPHTIIDLINFYRINNRLPSDNKEKSLYRWMNRERKKGNEEVIEFLDSIGYNYKKQNYNYHTIIDLINFYKINNRLPNSHIKEEKNLYNWMYYSKRREEDKEIINFLDLVSLKDKSIEAKEILESILKQI